MIGLGEGTLDNEDQTAELGEVEAKTKGFAGVRSS